MLKFFTYIVSFDFNKPFTYIISFQYYLERNVHWLCLGFFIVWVLWVFWNILYIISVIICLQRGFTLSQSLILAISFSDLCALLICVSILTKISVYVVCAVLSYDPIIEILLHDNEITFDDKLFTLDPKIFRTREFFLLRRYYKVFVTIFSGALLLYKLYCNSFWWRWEVSWTSGMLTCTVLIVFGKIFLPFL